jgi:two-component system response regulator RegX3
LLNKVWGYDRQSDIETRTIDIHIAKLRRKSEVDNKSSEYIITVRGVSVVNSFSGHRKNGAE